MILLFPNRVNGKLRHNDIDEIMTYLRGIRAKLILYKSKKGQGVTP